MEFNIKGGKTSEYVNKLCRHTMSRRPLEIRGEENFVTDDALLSRALSEDVFCSPNEVEAIDSSHTVMAKYSRITEEMMQALNNVARAKNKAEADKALFLFRQKYIIALESHKENDDVLINLPKWLRSQLHKINNLDLDTQIKVRKIIKKLSKHRGAKVKFDSFSTNNDMKNALNNVEFVSAEALLHRALKTEANIGEELELHKCSYTVDRSGSVSCKGCGKGNNVKKATHKISKKHANPKKSY